MYAKYISRADKLNTMIIDQLSEIVEFIFEEKRGPEFYIPEVKVISTCKKYLDNDRSKVKMILKHLQQVK